MPSVAYSIEDHVARITLDDAARRNVLDQAAVDALGQAVRRARADDAYVVVLDAAGDMFSVGGDVATFASADDPSSAVDNLAESLHRAISDLQRLDAIVVAVIQGMAAGAGFPLAAAADLVIAADTARFTLAYTKIGFSPDGGSTLLTATIGLHRALRLALLNPVLSADEAQQLGVVSEVHPAGELTAAVERIVAQLRSGSRAAQVAAKHLLREQALPAAEAGLRRESISVRALAGSPDGREGVRAFTEKRAPEFPSSNREPAT